jgi:WD40 repeat protein
LRFLAQNQVTIGVASNGTVHLWDLETGVPLKAIELGGSSFDPHSLSSDQHWLVGTDMPRPLLFRLLLFDLRTQQKIEAFAFSSTMTVAVAFSPDNRRLAYSYSVGPYGGEVSYLLAIWDLWSSRPKLTLEESAIPIGGLAFSPDSEMLVSGGWDGEIRVWSVRTGKPVLPSLKGHIISADERLAFSADGKTLVSYGGDRSIRLWSVATGQEMLVFKDCSMVSGNELAAYDPDYTGQAYLTAGDRWLLWRERAGPIQVTLLPTLAEIDSMEKSRR